MLWVKILLTGFFGLLGCFFFVALSGPKNTKLAEIVFGVVVLVSLAAVAIGGLGGIWAL